MKKFNKRRALFEQQHLFDSAGRKIVLCPLCLTVFDFSAIEGSNPTLTIEHAPGQKSVSGGVERCLTCKACNNENKFESRAGRRQANRKGGQDLLSFGHFGSSVPIRGSEVFHRLAPLPPNLLGLARPEEFIAELKTAYLLAFVTLGYEYILDASLDRIRDVIKGERPLDFRPCGVRPAGSWPDQMVFGVGGEFASVNVVMQAEHPAPDGGVHVVVLPRRESTADLYERIHPDLAVIRRRQVRLGSHEGYAMPPERHMSRRWDVRSSAERRVGDCLLKIQPAWAEDGFEHHE